MSFLIENYQKKLEENERNRRFWEEFLDNLEKLNFEQYNTKLKVPILVPVGSRILFRGELKHTNEVTVALGADYFAKCSTEQAEVLRQHRIKDAKIKIEAFKNEREFLDNQLLFRTRNIDKPPKDIVEFHTEEEDKAWREEHRKNMRLYKQNQAKEEIKNTETISDEDLWLKLEELELQEEMENDFVASNESLTVKDEKMDNIASKNVEYNEDEEANNTESSNTPRLDILQQVLNKQNELEQKITDLRNRDRNETKSEQDLLKRLDEMEQLGELEDEMDRLEEIIEDDVEDTDSEDVKTVRTELKRNVSFADEDDSATLEIHFRHSPIEPSNEPYNPVKGITKPSDIYEAFANSFRETTSILKKSKYEADYEKYEAEEIEQSNKQCKEDKEKISEDLNRTITINDVKERNLSFNNQLEDKNIKPLSLFKQSRLKRK